LDDLYGNSSDLVSHRFEKGVITMTWKHYYGKEGVKIALAEEDAER